MVRVPTPIGEPREPASLPRQDEAAERLDDLLIALIELPDLVTSSGPMRNAMRFIRRSTAGEMLNELRLAPDMLTLAATQQCEQPQRA